MPFGSCKRSEGMQQVMTDVPGFAGRSEMQFPTNCNGAADSRADKDRDRIFAWSNNMVGFDDPEVQTNYEEGQASAMQMCSGSSVSMLSDSPCSRNAAIVGGPSVSHERSSERPRSITSAPSSL